MELGIVGAIAATGYFLSNSKTKKMSPTKVESSVETFENESPVPPTTNTLPTPSQAAPQATVAGTPSGGPNVGTFTSLTGETIPLSDFTHGNMVPYFRGSVTQNTDENSFKQKLDMHTGAAHYQQPKTEQEPLFSNFQKDFGYVQGAPNQSSFMQDRQYVSSLQSNNKPFEEVRVGPGLNQGYTATPSGGFQQSDTLLYAAPRGVDELRTANNPKLSYEGRTVQGKNPIQNRGILGETNKYLPERYYENKDGERNLRTTGAHLKPTVRSDHVMKVAHRAFLNRENFGAGGPTGHGPQAEYVKGKYHAPHKRQQGSFGVRNANQEHVASTTDLDSHVNSYGKKGFEILPNERVMTEDRTYLSNFKSVIQELTAPILDQLRPAKKELVIGNQRQAGNVQKGFIKHTVYDKDDTARTTIKETTLYSKQGNVGGTNQEKGYVYDPNEVARTTIRETTEDNSHNGYIQGQEDGSAYVIAHGNTTAPLTQRQSEHVEYTGIAQGDIAGGGQDGYRTANMLPRATQKQDIATKEYTGNAVSDLKKPVSYDDAYEAKLNEAREIISKGRAPTQSGQKSFNHDIGAVSQTTEQANTYIGQQSRPNARQDPMASLGAMTQRREDVQAMEQRLEGIVNDQLSSNPFAHSIHMK